jgi:hypothetical protein
VFLIPAGLYLLLLWIAWKKGWLTVRFMALDTTISLGLGVVLLCKLAGTTEFLTLGLAVAVFTGLAFLSLPVVAPEVMKKGQLRW